ncbi:DUF397 domain-containing protein [Streptomyces sp. NPDC002520]
MTEPIRVWRKSSYSGADNGCVEIMFPPPRRNGPRFVTRRCPGVR